MPLYKIFFSLSTHLYAIRRCPSLLIAPEDVQGIIRYVEELYNASEAAESKTVVRKLEISRPSGAARGY